MEAVQDSTFPNIPADEKQTIARMNVIICIPLPRMADNGGMIFGPKSQGEAVVHSLF